MGRHDHHLSVFILEWLHARKHNKLISKSMLPKLEAFQSFEKASVLSEIDALHQSGYVHLNKITNGPRGIELVSIAQSGERFLRQHDYT